MKYATYFLAVPVPVILALLGLYRWTGLVPLLIQRHMMARGGSTAIVDLMIED